LEVKTSSGYSYALYSHEHQQFGSLLRVFAGAVASPVIDLSNVINQQLLFTHFFPLASELRQKDSPIRIAGHVDIPKWAVKLPIFRNGLPDRDGTIHDWWLWDGVKEWKVGSLNPKQIQSYPGLGTLNLPALIQMIENQWTSWDPEGRE